MIKQIIYVEDGSVDVERLKSQLTDETLVITYRSGACKPEILTLKKPIKRVSAKQMGRHRK